MKFIDFLPYIALLLLAVIIITVVSLPKKNMTTKEIAICSMCLALSFALSLIKLSPVPNGGSITFAAVIPIALYNYFAGLRKGMLCGVIYSLLQFIQEPLAIGFFQFILDYTIPFSMFGLVAVLKTFSKKLKGYDFLITLALCYIIRYFSHVTAGALYWGVSWPGSFIYSATYVPVDFAVAAVVLIALIQTKTVNLLEKIYLAKPAVNLPAVKNADESAPETSGKADGAGVYPIQENKPQEIQIMKSGNNGQDTQLLKSGNIDADNTAE